MVHRTLFLRSAFRRLLRYYGRQHWWPITSVDGRRLPPPRPMTEPAAVEIAIGAILTQNTAWGNVGRVLIALKRARLLSLQRIARTPGRTLGRLIRPSGDFNQKAKKLKAFAAFVSAHGHGRVLGLAGQSTPALRRALLRVHGIGPETADSILLYAFGRPTFVIDTYTKRWLATQRVNFRTYEEYRQFFEARLPRSTRLYQEFHALLVAWGKQQARPRPSPLNPIP